VLYGVTSVHVLWLGDIRVSRTDVTDVYISHGEDMEKALHIDRRDLTICDG